MNAPSLDSADAELSGWTDPVARPRHIRQTGVDFVKVDGGITRKLVTGEVARKKMSSILQASQSLRIGVVAEFGVGYAHGFGIFQPHPIGKIAAA